MSTRMPRFVRQDTNRHHRLGRKRKKLQKWRRPRGRHSKVRRKRFGYPVKVMVGFKQEKKTAHLVQGLKPVHVFNMADVSKVQKNSIIIIAARVGARKRIEIAKKANELGLKIANGGKQ